MPFSICQIPKAKTLANSRVKSQAQGQANKVCWIPTQFVCSTSPSPCTRASWWRSSWRRGWSRWAARWAWARTCTGCCWRRSTRRAPGNAASTAPCSATARGTTLCFLKSRDQRKFSVRYSICTAYFRLSRQYTGNGFGCTVQCPPSPRGAYIFTIGVWSTCGSWDQGGRREGYPRNSSSTIKIYSFPDFELNRLWISRIEFPGFWDFQILNFLDYKLPVFTSKTSYFPYVNKFIFWYPLGPLSALGTPQYRGHYQLLSKPVSAMVQYVVLPPCWKQNWTFHIISNISLWNKHKNVK